MLGAVHELGSRYLAGRQSWLVAFDRDGTLAPITDNPEDSHVPATTRRLLLRLALEPSTTVAIVSARGLRSLLQDFDSSSLVLCGNYGLEMVFPGERLSTNSIAGAAQTSLNLVRSRIRALMGEVEGLIVDDHGLSICVHWHRVERKLRSQISEKLGEAVCDFTDLKLIPQPTSHEIMPNISWNKSFALEQVVHRLKLVPENTACIYFGDSAADEPAFEWVNYHGGLSVKVGREGDTCALYKLKSHEEMDEFIAGLVQIRENWVISPNLQV